ncbi:MAG TPA: tail fiber domain-containing protein [Pyrinomonadaceae bacterium]|nr:tail fiber domain-containing protein [Pyrinomonadaceae bacterium]
MQIPGKLRLAPLGGGGNNHLCRNTSNNEVSDCSSSLRYKTNIGPFSFGLNLVRRLRPIRFEWKDGGMKDVGFGAEEVAAVEPLFVTYNDKGQVEGVKYDRISVALVNAVKEQQGQIEAQQTQLKQQQAQIEAQQQQLKKQQTLIDGLKKLFCQQDPKSEICR